jgi:hypothetical protein
MILLRYNTQFIDYANVMYAYAGPHKPSQETQYGCWDLDPLKFFKLLQRQVVCCWPFVGYLTATTKGTEVHSSALPRGKRYLFVKKIAAPLF